MIGLLALLGGVVTHPAAALAKSPISMDIGAKAISRPVAPGFTGLSIEYRSAPAYFGSDPAQPDPVFLELMRNLAPGGAPVLRFGGDTTDWTWWNTPGIRRPAGIQYTVGPSWVQSVHAIAAALGAKLILGINFEADSQAIAGTEATNLLAGIGPGYISGFELGNEPEVYGSLGWYAGPSGTAVPGRRASYDFGAYLTDYAHVASALPSTVPLIGPASGAPKWLAGLNRYLARNPRVSTATFHRYPLDRCFTPRSAPQFPTIAHLLSPSASQGLAAGLGAAVAGAHRRGVAFRVDELNSVACGGARGVSDTFASALWVLDTLFGMARAGVDGVNIHTFQNAIYEPFALDHTAAGWQAAVRPLYYGLLMFARAAPPGSVLLPALGAGPATLRTWATRGPDGRTRVLLINDAARRAATVSIRPPAPLTVAAGEQLRAPGLSSRTGVTLAGQSFGATTTTGDLTGTPTTFTVQGRGGRLTVAVPPASATLLTLGSGG